MFYQVVFHFTISGNVMTGPFPVNIVYAFVRTYTNFRRCRMHQLCSDEYVSGHEGVRKSIGSTRLGSAELVGWRSSTSVPGPECSQWSKAKGSKQSILHGNLPVGAFALRFVSYKSNSYNQVLDLSVCLFGRISCALEVKNFDV